MFRAGTSRRLRLLPWLLALGTLLLIGLFSYVSGRSYLTMQVAIRETLASRDAMVDTLSLLKDAETGVRGYLLTADGKFLESYDEARPRIGTRLAALEELGQEDPSQRAGARQVALLVREKLDVLGLMIARRSAGATVDKETLSLLAEGKRMMDALRADVARMLARADARLEERERVIAAATRRLQLILAVALIVGVLLTLAGLSGARREAERARRRNEELARDISARQEAERALRDQTRLLESVLESMGDGVVVLERSRRLSMINPAAARFLPWTVGETAPREWSRVSHTCLPDGKTIFPAEDGPLTRAIRGEATDSVDMMVRVPGGELRSYSVTGRPITGEGTTAAAVAVFRDTTNLQRAEKELFDSEQRYRVLSEASFEGFAITKDARVLDTNANVARWLGYDPKDLIGMPVIALFAPEEHQRVLKFGQTEEAAYEARMLRRDRTTFPVEIRSRFVTYHGGTVRIATIRDVTEKKQREAQLLEQSEQLRALSLRDELTGLLNRRGFLEVAEYQLKTAVRARQHCAVFFADLNGMKQINDHLGHETGDHAIRAAADILRRVFRSSDVVSRLGGDEFAVFANECDESGIGAACARIERAVADWNAISDSGYSLSISMGAAVKGPDSALDLAGLVQAADFKMYEIKRAKHARTPPDRRARATS